MAEVKAAVSSAAQIDPNAKEGDNVDPNAPKKDAPASKTYSQEEVDRILGKVRKNARYLGRKEAEAELLRQGATPRQAAEAVDDKAAPAEDKEPKRDEFDNYEDYQRAVTRFEAKKATREEASEREKKDNAKREQEAQENVARSWHAKIEAAVEKHPDFEDVLEDNPETLELVRRAPMRGAITESDIGPEIVRHLCQNPAEAKRIAALPAYKQAAEIVKIEEKLTAAAPKADPDGNEDDDQGAPKPKGEPKPKPAADADRNADGTFKPKKEPSKAPDPIEPIGGRSANTSAAPSDKDDPETWRRKRVAELEARKPRR